MDVIRELARLDDRDASRVLESILRGWSVVREENAQLLAAEEALHSLAAAAAPGLDLEDSSVRSRAVRALLVTLAEDDALSGHVEGAVLHLSTARRLTDPVTASLVLGGLIFLLGSHIKVERKNGKLSWSFEKKPTQLAILGKFFALFES